MKKYWILILCLSLCVCGGVIFSLASHPLSPTNKEIEILKTVFPHATTFSQKSGKLLHYKAYEQNAQTRKKELIGVAFLTTDIVPQERGYAGPIQMLVGCDLHGTIKGIHLIEHSETTSFTGNFDEFLKQFPGKNVNNPFQLNQDINGISGATISSEAITRAIKKSLDIIARDVLHQQKQEMPMATKTVSQDIKEKLNKQGLVPIEAKYWRTIDTP